MIRRSHKKSRAGCLECKRRHIKCDEHHPCVNCSTASIQCSFATTTTLISPQAIRGNEPRTIPASETTSRSSTPTSGSDQPPAFAPVEPYVNAMHVELFYSIMEGGEWAFGDDDQKGTRPHVLKHAFTYPFLLSELLAVSALHLSTRRPAQQSIYREEATRLQSQALRLFNETVRDLTPHNIIPAFLFSGLQGIATFFETFHDPTYDPNDWTFFEKIVQSIRLLQGVRTIIGGRWHFLMQSDIKDILEEPAAPIPEWSDEVVDQFDTFRLHILQSPGLDQAQALVCETAIEQMVWVYKSAFGNGACRPPHDQAAAQHATRWLIVVPPAYTDLLVLRRPEALIILGHFAIILHKLRDCWTVGDAGLQLLLVVEAHLEESWHLMLAWPKMFVTGMT